MTVDLNRIHFVSYCWSLGTTSFRTKQFNYKIERQLELLNDFFKLPNNNEIWMGNNDLQIRYYDYLKENDFIKGEAKRKDKDAREKTSGLVELGLIDENRRVTEVGIKLIEILQTNNYKGGFNNLFGIDNDSYIYLLQLLKYTTSDNVRPFVVLLKVLSELDYITDEEFKYILPLAINERISNDLVENIKQLRAGYTTVDKIIIDSIWKMDNYNAAFEYFLENEVSEEMFVLINMNRKSGELYERPYAKFYQELLNVYIHNQESSIINLYQSIEKLSGNARRYWKQFLFNRCTLNALRKNPKRYLKECDISNLKDDNSIKKFVFERIHLFKWKSTLDDYEDLNRRYFRLSDIVLFEDSKVCMTYLAKEYFNRCIDKFFVDSFKPSDGFDKVTSINEILGECVPDEKLVYEDIAAHFEEEFIAPADIQKYVDNERLATFNKLIDEKFSDNKLIELLDYFKERNDTALNEYITDNADVPTLFEYVLGIIWYKLSERKGDILNYMNLSLDAGLLPKQHAGGGEADIVYKYEATKDYPEHELLLEATLQDDANQRRMEYEPVSRHLLQNLLATNNLDN